MFKIMWVYGVLPILIIYTNLMPREQTGGFFAGFLFFWFIAIRPRLRKDAGIHYHELEHAKQHVRCLGLWVIFYLLNRSFRLKSEVEAYRVQLLHLPAAMNSDKYQRQYARYLASKTYWLDIEYKETLKLLEKGR